MTGRSLFTVSPMLGIAAAISGLTACGSGGNSTGPVTPPSIAITRITPDTLIEGQSATITGTSFSTTAAEDTVTIDGVRATVTGATTTTLAVTVPSYSCRPARIAAVSVKVGTQVGTSSAPLHPVAFLTLAVGQEAIVPNLQNFCFEFRAAASGPETYVFGLSTPAAYPGVVLPFLLRDRKSTRLNSSHP